ncbi:hypothetical protein TIFTF001_020959 [Ficus carica]|uniref:Uncharacterized protein n=1 Tax=Ficus carica TaxID=3494 RepID=A0AA88A9M1_FICCA|nr:hypothetical protein TIFTF001_020959 [Ficus carica]
MEGSMVRVVGLPPVSFDRDHLVSTEHRTPTNDADRLSNSTLTNDHHGTPYGGASAYVRASSFFPRELLLSSLGFVLTLVQRVRFLLPRTCVSVPSSLTVPLSNPKSFDIALLKRLMWLWGSDMPSNLRKETLPNLGVGVLMIHCVRGVSQTLHARSSNPGVELMALYSCVENHCSI